MRVGHAFSAVLDPSVPPLFSDQGPLDLLPEEVWHASARSPRSPAPPGRPPDAGTASAKVPTSVHDDGDGDGGGASSDDSDDSLQPYDLPEEEDEGAPAPALLSLHH